ncbi:thioredoxin-like/ATP-binding protein [Actinidia rufa]|uniref:Thioredoxin-like/ATP-binding protein n=1 Tax=Actinidia rufa TaxID=165716 RepID=A0A7J0E5L7_9ERIC|nr:thioredoxin-like/ATP-binding protein [Actinidia rufa]
MPPSLGRRNPRLLRHLHRRRCRAKPSPLTTTQALRDWSPKQMKKMAEKGSRWITLVRTKYSEILADENFFHFIRPCNLQGEL